MERITKNSTTTEKAFALSAVQATILNLKYIEKLGLATANTIASVEDLKVYEKQLSDYIRSEREESRISLNELLNKLLGR